MVPLLGLATFGVVGCIETETTQCADVLCSPDRRCIEVPGLGPQCLLPGQVEACEGKAEGESCTFGLDAVHSCRDGVCREGGCGNGRMEPGEQCDGTDIPSTVCDFGGQATCRSDCTIDDTTCSKCGNGELDAGEFCDPGNVQPFKSPNLGGKTCADDPRGARYRGEPACASDCSELDYSLCEGFCGDNTKDPEEVCDGLDLGGRTCATEKFYQGNLGCAQNCKAVDTGPCLAGGYCGDGIAQPQEACDGAESPDCAAFLYYTGGKIECPQQELRPPNDPLLPTACTPTLDVKNVCSEYCGDGVVNGAELCDGTAFAGLSCASFGYYDGYLTCKNNVPSANPISTNSCVELVGTCQGYCGDGIVHGDEAEQCDSTNHNNASCLQVGGVAGALRCTGFCGRQSEMCAFEGFSPVPSPTTKTLRAVARHAGLLVAVGDDGTLVEGVGEAWTLQSTPIEADLYALASFDAGVLGQVLFAVGSGGAVWRRQVNTWTNLSPSEASDVTWRSVLYDNGGGGDRLIVGGEGVLGVYENDVWSLFPTPSITLPDDTTVPGTVHALWRSTGEKASCGGGGESAFVLHALGDFGTSCFDGANFGSAGGPATRAVYDQGLGQAIFVGDAGYFGDTDGFAYPIGTTLVTLNAVDGFQGRVFAVGTDGVTVRRQGSENAKLEYLDSSVELYGVAVTSASEAYAVGQAGAIHRWRGVGWEPMSGSPLPSAVNDILWVGSNLASVGDFGFGAFAGTGTWESETSPTPIPPLNQPGTCEPGEVRSVWGSFELTAQWWAVGASGGLYSSSNGFIWTQLCPSITGITSNLADIWGRADNDVYAVGDSATVLHYDGTGWSTLSLPVQSDLRAVWTAPNADVFIAGEDGVHRYDGTSVSTGLVGEGVSIRALWGADTSNVVAVGDGGAIYRWNGSDWSKEALATDADLKAVWGRSFDDIYAVGEAGSAYRFDGERWSPMKTPTLETLLSVSGNKERTFMTGSQGSIIERETIPPRFVPRPGCLSAIPVYCGSSVVGTVAKPADVKSNAPACSWEPLGGGRVEYWFESPLGGTATVTLTPHVPAVANLALLVDDTSVDAPACTGACAGVSDLGPTVTETVTLDNTMVMQGSTFRIMVESAPLGADERVSFTLDVDCSKAPVGEPTGTPPIALPDG